MLFLVALLAACGPPHTPEPTVVALPGPCIAFTSDRDSDPKEFPLSPAEIYVMNADGSGQTRLTTDPDRDLSPSWCP